MQDPCLLLSLDGGAIEQWNAKNPEQRLQAGADGRKEKDQAERCLMMFVCARAGANRARRWASISLMWAQRKSLQLVTHLKNSTPGGG